MACLPDSFTHHMSWTYLPNLTPDDMVATFIPMYVKFIVTTLSWSESCSFSALQDSEWLSFMHLNNRSISPGSRTFIVFRDCFKIKAYLINFASSCDSGIPWPINLSDSYTRLSCPALTRSYKLVQFVQSTVNTVILSLALVNPDTRYCNFPFKPQKLPLGLNMSKALLTSLP